MRELTFPDAVEEAQDLFDRTEPVNVIREALRRPARRTVVILGGRLLGKTSLLNVVARWAADEASYVVVRLAHAGSREELMAEIVHGVHERVGADRATARELFGHSGLLRSSTVASFVKTVQDLSARAPGVRFLLCVDEIDGLLRGCDDQTARQILDLVLYLTEQARLPIRFLFTMARIPDRVRLSYSSPFLNQSTIVELQPWSATESRDFADWLLGDDLPLEHTAHAVLFDAAGGHPYFTKAVLKAMVDATSGTTQPSPAEVRSAVEAAVRSREVDVALSNIADVHLAGKPLAVLDQVAASPAGLVAGNIRDVTATDGVLETLTDAGLLTRDGRRYVLRLGLWRQWRAAREVGAYRPGALVRLTRVVHRLVGGKGVRAGLLSALALLLALAFGPGLLYPDQDLIVADCDGAASGLRTHVSYPSYVSNGDEYRLRVDVVNDARSAVGPVDGSIVVGFSVEGSGRVSVNGDNGDSFTLKPGQQHSLVVAFTHTQPGSVLPDTRPRVPVELKVDATGGSCPTRQLSLAVAPVPHLRGLQSGAVWLMPALFFPLLIEWLLTRRAVPGTSKTVR